MATGSLAGLLASANRIIAENIRRTRSRKPRGLIVSFPPQENDYANAFMHYSSASAIESIVRVDYMLTVSLKGDGCLEKLLFDQGC
jgi:hypothetical protein